MRPHSPHPKRYSPYSAYTKQPNLSRPTKAAGRFATSLSMAEVDRAGNKFIPKNTRKVNKWATTVFIDWLTQRNETVSDSEDIRPGSGHLSTGISKKRWELLPCQHVEEHPWLAIQGNEGQVRGKKYHQFYGKGFSGEGLSKAVQRNGSPIPTAASKWSRCSAEAGSYYWS